MKKALYILLLLAPPLLAQTPRTIATWPLSLKPNVPVSVEFDQPYTSALLKFPEDVPLDETYLIAGGDTLSLAREPHSPTGYASTLCVFRQPVRSVTLLPGTLSGRVDVVSLYVPPLPPATMATWVRSQARGGASDCEKPTVVPISVWRQGLTPPKELPVQTKVQFVIVHHAVTSNTATNFTDIVRNIYVGHTQDNGWNDIGYNFVVAQNGTIYEGRDGHGRMDGDNVLGAHFCGTNSGTMGICLLGNLSQVQPTDTAVASLNRLIGWKLRKEGLAPTGQALHPGSNKQLNLISGHRDGTCATECPGNNLYARLPQIRQTVGQLCSFTLIAPPVLAVSEPADEWTIYPNPGNGPITVRHATQTPEQVRFEWVDAQGRTIPVRTQQIAPDRWQLDGTSPTLLTGWLRCQDGDRKVVRKLLFVR